MLLVDARTILVFLMLRVGLFPFGHVLFVLLRLQPGFINVALLELVGSNVPHHDKHHVDFFTGGSWTIVLDHLASAVGKFQLFNKNTKRRSSNNNSMLGRAMNRK
jgi:hypothetical protein